MDEKRSVIQSIETKINDDDFLLSILDEHHHFDGEHLNEILALTLSYYILTRDSDTSLSVNDIKKGFDSRNHGIMSPKDIENTIELGYLTHSFNGMEQEYIKKYGFNYFDKLPQDEQRKVLRVRLGLKKLESEIGKNIFLTYREEENEASIVEKELFLTLPGTKTVHYCSMAPERFYLGPLGRDSFSYFPMVVGESKTDYVKRILRYRIENMTFKIEPQRLIDIADNVAEFYTQKSPSIAFVPIKDLIDKPVYANHYGEGDGQNLKRFCDLMKTRKFYPIHAFTSLPGDEYEPQEDKGNLVVLSSDITVSNLEFSSFPDSYDVRQKYLLNKGTPKGTLVDYYSCKKIEYDYEIPSYVKAYYK